MAQLEDFYSQVLVEVPGCPEPLVDLHLVAAAREFCRITGAWRATLDPVDTVPGQAEYELDSPETQSEIVRLTRLEVAGKLLWADELPVRRHTAAYRRTDPPFWLGNDNRSIRIDACEVPTAATPGGLVLEGALSPITGATALPDFLKLQHLDAMRVSTLSRLLMLGNQPWTDRAMATVHRTAFEQAMARARYRADTGNTERPLRTRKWG